MKRFLVTGSIAYDNLMEYNGDFKDSISNEKDSLSVSFLVQNLKKQRGGTAPNISYNLSLIGMKPELFGSVGCDFDDYNKWLVENGIGNSYLNIVKDDYTANCFVTTDTNLNQITSFYPGAMSCDASLSLNDIDCDDFEMVIIAPTVPEAMSNFVKECKNKKIKYMYDPGMQIPRINEDDLAEGVLNSCICIMNDYEFSMLNKKTSLSKEDILKRVELFVITRGVEGSSIYSKDNEVHVPVAEADQTVDPTGAGDAYRAGLLKGYIQKSSLELMGLYASVTSVYAVEVKGATNHKYSLEDIKNRFYNNFGGSKKW